MKTERKEYETPCVEVVQIQVEQAVLTASLSGEDIDGWENM